MRHLIGLTDGITLVRKVCWNSLRALSSLACSVPANIIAGASELISANGAAAKNLAAASMYRALEVLSTDREWNQMLRGSINVGRLIRWSDQSDGPTDLSSRIFQQMLTTLSCKKVRLRIESGASALTLSLSADSGVSALSPSSTGEPGSLHTVLVNGGAVCSILRTRIPDVCQWVTVVVKEIVDDQSDFVFGATRLGWMDTTPGTDEALLAVGKHVMFDLDRNSDIIEYAEMVEQ